MDYRVELDTFSGPLDLLLALVKREEVDARDIPIARVVDQFADYVCGLEALDVDAAADYLVMLVNLVELKSRLVLPRDPEADDADDDPHFELVRQLMEYRTFKDAAGRLNQLAEAAGVRLARRPVPEPAAAGPPPLQAVELWDLVSAFGRLVTETQALAPATVLTDETPMQVHQEAVMARLRAGGRVRFLDLFEPPYDKGRFVGVFLAILELIKGRFVLAEQPERFGEIVLCLRPDSGAEPGPEPAA